MNKSKNVGAHTHTDLNRNYLVELGIQNTSRKCTLEMVI